MEQQRRDYIKGRMVDISKMTHKDKSTDLQDRGEVIYYDDFVISGSGLGLRNIYVHKVPQKESNIKEEADNTIYKIWSEEGELIATVTGDGKIHFTEEYLAQLQDIDERYFEQLNLENLDFELPEKLTKNDLVMTSEELTEYEKKISKGQTINNRTKTASKIQEEETEEKQVEQETEEEKKERSAESLGIEASDIKSICTINPNEKITDKHNLIDLMPEAAGYSQISIVYSNSNNKGNGQFTILGVTKEGKREPIDSIEPVEGTSTSKSVISVNEDGSEISEKQVKGLFRINSRSRNDGISVSIGDYGMMDVDYVSNVMDKSTRRATPIRTREAENQRIPTAEVRENAGDSIEEMRKEGKIFRERQKEGIDPQTLDGIDIDRADGESMTLEQLKENIKEKALEQGDMSRGELQDFITAEITKSGLDLSDQEKEMITGDIAEMVLDESRFPTRGNRM